MTRIERLRAQVSSATHRILNAFGIEVRLLRNVTRAHAIAKQNREMESWQILQGRRFRTILDIGANEGQFLWLSKRIWPAAHVHCFEPLPEIFSKLELNASQLPNCSVYRLGLSNQRGTAIMHQSAFSPSSSLLPMADLHRTEFPASAACSEVAVPLTTMDQWAVDTGVRLDPPLLIKIDVQGFERAVIEGGGAVLSQAEVIVLEVSFCELYQGQPLFGEIHELLARRGFIYRGNVEQYTSKDCTRVLFADAIFENTSLRNRTTP